MKDIIVILDEANSLIFPKSTILVSAIIVMLVYVGLYLCLSIALYCMAIRRNINRCWLAYLPFARWSIFVKLIGEGVFFGRSVKNFDKITISVIAVNFVLSTLSICLYYYPVVYGFFTGQQLAYDVMSRTLLFQNGAPLEEVLLNNYPAWLIMVINVIELLSYVTDAAKMFIVVVLYIGIFRKYAPSKYILFSLIAIFANAGGIILLCLRNKQPVNYADYVRQRQYNFYNNVYGGQGGNPYGDSNNYNNPNNYGSANSEPFNDYTEKKESNNDEPFAEFNEDNNKNND